MGPPLHRILLSHTHLSQQQGGQGLLHLKEKLFLSKSIASNATMPFASILILSLLLMLLCPSAFVHYLRYNLSSLFSASFTSNALVSILHPYLSCVHTCLYFTPLPLLCTHLSLFYTLTSLVYTLVSILHPYLSCVHTCLYFTPLPLLCTHLSLF